MGAAVIAPGGWLMLVGLAVGTLPLSPAVGKTPVPFGARVIIPYWGMRAELAEVIALAHAGCISANVEKFPLNDAPL